MGSLDDPAIYAYLSNRAVLAPDLLGYGEFSATPPARLSIAAQVEHVHRLVTEHFGAGPVHLLGHSMGGAIAPLFAAAHPHLVATIIDVEGNFTLKDAFWSGQLARATEAEAEEMLARQRADPATWLARLGIAINERTLVSAMTGFVCSRPRPCVQWVRPWSILRRSPTISKVSARYSQPIPSILWPGNARATAGTRRNGRSLRLRASP